MKSSRKFKLELLTTEEMDQIHRSSLRILGEIGVKIHSEKILSILSAQRGASVDPNSSIVRFSEDLVMSSVESSAKKACLCGRDKNKVARFGYGELNNWSMMGDFAWLDGREKVRRDPTLKDAQQAIALGDALPNIDIVGAMAEPVEIPIEVRDIHLYAELVRGTTKPVMAFIHNPRTARYILEILQAVAGGEDKLRERPLTLYGMEPISPLQFGQEGLDILSLFAEKGLPVAIGPMAQSIATAPATLAGTIAQENAEILAGVVITQTLSPGLPVLYAGVPHIMDPVVSNISFGSPEQGIMAVAMTEMGKFYGFPVVVNVGLTDSKVSDAQLGLEKGTTLLLGALAGAEIFGALGLVGTDKAASLAQLIIDDEIVAYVKRILRGLDVNEENLAFDVIKAVGIGGNFLAEEHTVEHFRKELWFPRLLDRESWDAWLKDGARDILDRALEEQERILREHQVEPLEESLAKEIAHMVRKADQEILG